MRKRRKLPGNEAYEPEACGFLDAWIPVGSSGGAAAAVVTIMNALA